MPKPLPPESSEPKKQCPYHGFAQTQTLEGDKLTELAEMLNRLFNNLISYQAGSRRNDVIEAFTGKLTLHASLHNQGTNFPRGDMPIPSDKHTPLGRMIGNIHAEYRKAAYTIGGLLDVESLAPETRESIKRFQEVIRLYRHAVQETARTSVNGLPNYELLSLAQKAHFKTIAEEAITGLKNSGLMTAQSVPIKTEQGVVHVDNTVLSRAPGPNRDGPTDMKLGLYLFVLQETAGTQIDHNKLPPAISQFAKSVGVLADIPRTWSFMGQPRIKAQVEQICGQTYQHALAEVRNEAHALQVAHLMLSIDDANGRYAHAMCEIAGIAPYPEALSSPLEAAVILESLNLATRPSLEHEKMVLGSAARALLKDEPLTQQQAMAVEGTLARLPVPSANESADTFSTGEALLTEFLKQYRSPSHPRVAESDAAIRQGR